MAKNWTRKRLRALNWPNSGNVSTRLLRKGGYPRGHFSFFVFGFCLMAEESLGEIGDFLKNLGLVEYLPSLLDHGIENLEVLRLIDLENLVQIGITRENARLILDRLANPNDPAPVPVRAPVPVPSQNDRGSGEEFEIFLKTMTGGTLTLEVTTQTTVDGLIDIIQQKEGLPRDQITLIWATKQISMKEPCLWSQKGNSIVLWDGTPLRTFPNPQYCHIYTTLKDVESLIPQSKLAEFREYRAAQDAQIRAFHARTLTSHNIQNESTLHLQVHLRGDIGLFDLHLETPGIDLLQAPKNLNGEGLEVKDIIEKVKENKGVPVDRKSNRFESYTADDESSLLLSNEECQILKDFLDQKFFGEVSEGKESGIIQHQTSRRDFQVTIQEEELMELIGERTTRKVLHFFNGPVSEIKLRRVCSQGTCINFHLDFSLRTMQIPLNSDQDYEGGRLVYLTEDGKIEAPSRPTGSWTIHDNTIVHGVTTLESGIRYGLFFLQCE